MPTMTETTTPLKDDGAAVVDRRRRPLPDGRHDAEDRPAPATIGTADPDNSCDDGDLHSACDGDDAEPEPAGTGDAERRFLSSQRRRIERNAIRATRRREENDRVSDPSESVPAFWSDFRSARTSIEGRLDAMLAEDGGLGCRYVTAAQRNRGREELDELRDEAVNRLQDEASRGAAVFLPAADARRAGEEAAEVLRRIERARDVVCPREKFVFRRYRAAMEAKMQKKMSEVSEQRRDEDIGSRKGASSEASRYDARSGRSDDGDGFFGFEGRSGCSLSLTKGDDKGLGLEAKRDGMVDGGGGNFRLSNLEDCVVTLKETFGSVRMDNLRNCTVYCGPVCGSAYVDSCADCTIFVASRQLRVHDTHRVDFHVFVLSGPIIEDCSEVRFSGIYGKMMRYAELDGHMVSSGLLSAPSSSSASSGTELAAIMDENNEYSNVKDFKWHNLLERSPNWSLMSDDEASRHVSKSDEIEIVRVDDDGDAGDDTTELAGGSSSATGRNGRNGGEGAATGRAIEESSTSEHGGDAEGEDDGDEEDEL